MEESWDYVWEVESADEAAGSRRISLVRRREHRSSKRLRSHTETVERTVLFSRSFRPLLEAVELEHFFARLQLVARHCQEGQFGCFAQTRSEAGSVLVLLYERSFDGADIRTEELARRAFDASDEQALVASTEFLADLQIWADRRNEEREAAILQERDADAAAELEASERAAASRQLDAILTSHARQSGPEGRGLC